MGFCERSTGRLVVRGGPWSGRVVTQWSCSRQVARGRLGAMCALMPGSPSPELARLFDVCHRIEMAHARLYRTLEVAHSYDRSIASLWRKTANEEEGHGAQFRLAANYSGSITHVALDLAQATQMLDSVEATVRELQARPPAVPEALRLAIRMEEAMEKLHMDQLAQFENSAHQKLFRAMMGVDQAHVQSLRDALARIEGRTAHAE